LLANHGTVTFGKDLEQAYFNSEIIDAYCKILILAKQLGPINYFSEEKTRELLALKKRLGFTDPRLDNPDCDICGDGTLATADPNFVLKPQVFVRDEEPQAAAKSTASDFDKLVRTITDQVLAQMRK
jgi:L-fuculose-phosphate aldolase